MKAMLEPRMVAASTQRSIPGRHGAAPFGVRPAPSSHGAFRICMGGIVSEHPRTPLLRGVETFTGKKGKKTTAGSAGWWSSLVEAVRRGALRLDEPRVCARTSARPAHAHGHALRGEAGGR